APGRPQRPEPQVGKSQPVASSAAVQPSRGFAQTPVLAVIQESDDIKTIRLQRPQGFHFKPGQFLPVRIRVDGKELVRCYSISSSPSSEGFLEISVKRQGLVSNALHATARPGSILTVKAPNGHFTYPADDDRPIVLIAGGIGITPLISMLRHGVHAEPSRPVTLIYSAHDRRGLAFFDELALLSSRHPQVRTIFALTKEAPPGPAFYPGRIDRELLHTTVPDIRDAISLMCGPTQMIDAMKALLTDLAVPTDQIRYELFEAAVAASTGPSPEAPRRSAAMSPTASGSAADSSCAMHCLPGNETVAVAAGQTILEAAEGNGVDLPSLCRAGVCGTCRVRVTKGEVDCDTTTLDASELSQGYVLACVATPRTDCTVQL
ncbi:MAG: iron-sulfur cluster-binding domain-containing protein, partial [Vicinamibacterales bacterium]